MRLQGRGRILARMSQSRSTPHGPTLALLLAAAGLALGCGKTGMSASGSGDGGDNDSGGTVGQGGGSGGSGGNIGLGGSGGGRTGTVVSSRVPALHRPAALSCAGVHPTSDPAGVMFGDCKKHADCTAGTNGRCVSGIGYMGNSFRCIYDQCATDDGCDPGKVCYCTANEAARCLSVGNCRIDADCGSHGHCSPSNGWDCGGYHTIDSYYCHTPQDTCIDNSDCTGMDYCNYDPVDGRWECTSPNMNCAIG